MAKNRDILTGDDGDILIKDGIDLVFGDADSQSLEKLVMLNQGEIKYAPMLGYGGARLTNSRMNKIVEEGKLRQQLTADNWKNTTVDIDGQDVYVYGERND